MNLRRLRWALWGPSYAERIAWLGATHAAMLRVQIADGTLIRTPLGHPDEEKVKREADEAWLAFIDSLSPPWANA